MKKYNNQFLNEYFKEIITLFKYITVVHKLVSVQPTKKRESHRRLLKFKRKIINQQIVLKVYNFYFIKRSNLMTNFCHFLLSFLGSINLRPQFINIKCPSIMVITSIPLTKRKVLLPPPPIRGANRPI